MTRDEMIEEITRLIEKLSGDALEMVLSLIRHLSRL